jgi:hypothetical protein
VVAAPRTKRSVGTTILGFNMVGMGVVRSGLNGLGLITLVALAKVFVPTDS